MLPRKTAAAERKNILAQVLSSDFFTTRVPVPIQVKCIWKCCSQRVPVCWHAVAQVQMTQNAVVPLAGMAQLAVLTDPHNFLFLADGVAAGSGFSELN